MTKKNGKVIQKWDEVNGTTAIESPADTSDPTEIAGVGPSISRNFMRGIEDMVEQNDNNFDGVINNVNTELPDGLKAAHEQEQESVLEALKKARPQPKESEEPKRIFPPELCL